MDDRMQALAAGAARQLLQSFREDYPQWAGDRTPLDELTAWLGLEIATFHPDDYPQGTYGFVEPEENLVWLCRDLPQTLRRFTLAHELGHVVLHRQAGQRHFSYHPTQLAAEPGHGVSREDLCQTRDVREEVAGLIYQQQAEELLGPGLSYDPRSERELAANIFAAELLMPLERVRALYLAGEVPANKLASVFDVSNAAMLNRLAGLLQETKETSARETSAGGEKTPAYSPAESRKQYDEFQQAAIEAPVPALIVAGPGSGKTSTLIGRAEYLIDSLGIPPENILALTFSRKAAEEMQERLQQVLDAQAALPKVSTFHAFCAELLRTYGSLVSLRQDFAFIDDAEGYFLLLRLASELPLHHYQNLNTPTYYFPAILSAISRAKDELVTPAEYKRLSLRMQEQASTDEEIQEAEKALEIAEIYALYQAALERQGDSDFGGLIMLTVELLQKHPELRQELQQKYQHILVDEFQDINRASGVLLRELAGDARRVWVVGDANQAIYSFRGASPANIANFRDDYPNAVILPLSRNYRSRPDIVSLAEGFRYEHLEPGGAQGTVQTARSGDSDTYVTLATAPDEASELNGLISDIRRKQAAGYNFRDMVVLCRTRAQARKITQALIAANLPVIERGGLLEQEHIKNLLSIVMLLAEPSGMGILRAARQPDHPLRQGDIEELLLAAREQNCSLVKLMLDEASPPGPLSIKDGEGEGGEAGSPLQALSIDGRRSLARLATILKELYLSPNIWSLLVDYLFIETSLVRSLLACVENVQARRVLADYAGLLQLARYFDQQQQALRFHKEQEAFARSEDAAAITLPAIQEQARGFLDYLSVLLTLRHDGGNRREGTESDDEATPDVVRVMTVHASKGLEFPIVYLPGIVKQRFPIQRRGNPVEPPTGMLPAESEGDAAHETGEACLFYVGATRARDHLVLSYAERYGRKNYKRSAYIDALVAGLPEERITRVVWQDGQDASPPGPLSIFDGEGEGGEAGVGRGPLWSPSSQKASAWFEPASVQPGERFIEAGKPKTLTISALETYQRCPRRYMYGTIYGFRGDDTAYRLFWKATQDTLEALKHKLEANKGAKKQDTQFPTQEETQELYTHYWRELGGHTSPFAALYERHGHEVTELVRRKLLASGDTSWQLRQNFTVDIAGKTIELAVDRVEAPDQVGEPVKFVRAHFGKRKAKPAPATRELLYARASRQHQPGRNIELLVHNMSTGETFQIKLTEKKEQSLYNEVEQAILALESNEFPPKPDAFVCPTCPFFLICPA